MGDGRSRHKKERKQFRSQANQMKPGVVVSQSFEFIFADIDSSHDLKLIDLSRKVNFLFMICETLGPIMSWFSILPAHLTVIETWVIRLFVGFDLTKLCERRTLLSLQLLLGIATIGPWAILIVYDLLLYIIRSISYEIPYFGGRARGRRKPKAPSLAERPNGRPRSFSISVQTPSSSGKAEKRILRESLRESPARDDD